MEKGDIFLKFEQKSKKLHERYKMNLKRFTYLAILIALIINITAKADDLNTKKMEQVTKEILEIMVKGDNAGEKLRKYISDDWLDNKRLNVKKYLINNYSPETYEILYASGDVCVTTIGGSSWQHLVIFKFTEEYGMYRVVPRGISEASNDYIDPWIYVKDYICEPETNYKETPNEDK